jgi:hypothetical protein
LYLLVNWQCNQIIGENDRRHDDYIYEYDTTIETTSADEYNPLRTTSAETEKKKLKKTNQRQPWYFLKHI